MSEYSLLQGNTLDVLKTLSDESVDCVCTSPPYYGLRDYQTGEWIDGDENCKHKPHNTPGPNADVGNTISLLGRTPYKHYCPECGAIRVDQQLGLEDTPEMYVDNIVQVFREISRVLKDTGTVWVNLGDTYMGNGGASRHLGYNDPKYENGRNGDHIEPQAFKHNYIKPKSLIGIPWRVALAMQYEGWIIRSDIIWHKINPLPESVRDRPTKAHEYIFLLVKNQKYYYDIDAIREPFADGTLPRLRRGVSDHHKWLNGADGQSAHTMSIPRPNLNKIFGRTERKMLNTGFGGDGPGLHEHSGYFDKDGRPRFNEKGRNRRTVWTVSVKPLKEKHYAAYPQELIEPCILAGCPVGGVVLDPFCGSGTTGIVALQNDRRFIGIDLNTEYLSITEKRLTQVTDQLKLKM